MVYSNAYTSWETTQRLTCHYDLFSQTVRLQKAESKGTFVCSVQHRALCMNTGVRFIVAGDVTCRKGIVVQQSVFLYSWQWHVAQRHTRNALLSFHCNNGYANALQNYLIHTKPIFFSLQRTGKCFFTINEILDGDKEYFKYLLNY